MKKIGIRYQRVSDAGSLFQILSNPNFKYFSVRVASVKEEAKWLSLNPGRRKRREEFNYTILLDQEIIGGIGLSLDRKRPFTGEIGYFIAEKYWGRGLTSQAVKLVEQEGFKKLGLRRLEILMRPANKASERVAIKNHYRKEGFLKKAVKDRQDKFHDVWLYAKTR